MLEGLLNLVDGLKEESGAIGGGKKKRKRDEEGLVDEFERDVGEGIDSLLERAVSDLSLSFRVAEMTRVTLVVRELLGRSRTGWDRARTK